jgi:hypothetical protein
MTHRDNQTGSPPSTQTDGWPPDCSRWLSVLNDLHYDPARGIAPHKPLLLLVLCDLAEEGKLSTSTLQRNGDLAFRFSSYFRAVALRRGTKPDVRLPFFHLRTEGVWTGSSLHQNATSPRLSKAPCAKPTAHSREFPSWAAPRPQSGPACRLAMFCPESP